MRSALSGGDARGKTRERTRCSVMLTIHDGLPSCAGPYLPASENQLLLSVARRTSPSSTDPSEPPALHLPLTPRIAALAASAVALLVYLLTMNRSIGTMDSGEIAAATCTLGIMHPT